MAYAKIPLMAGIYKDDSPLTAEGFFTDANKVRFHRGKAQTIGGWEKASTSTVVGKARTVKAWSDNAAKKRLAIATHLRLYAMDVGGTLTDITPVAGSSTIVNGFSTTAGSSTVSIAWGSDHPLFEGQKINWTSATAVGGITLNGDYSVSVTNASTIAVQHGTAATSTASGGGSAVATYYVAGNEHGIGGLGFGVGQFSTGYFGLAATGYGLSPLTYTLDLWGQDLLANPRGSGIYASDGSAIATAVTNAPTQNTCIFVTQERSLVSCGNNGVGGAGTFDPRNVRWTKLGDRTSWAASATVSAGNTTISQGSRIVRGLPGVGQNYIWTLDGMWTMTYIPDPTIVYRLDRVGFDNCGLIGPNAVGMLQGIPYWMAPGQGEFYTYQNGVIPLDCTVRRDIADNLSRAQHDKISCLTIAAYNEVWWLFPDKRDGNECSRYVIYNTLERTWATGKFDRTSGCDSGIFPYPLLVSNDGYIYFHEKGNSAAGAPLSWSLTAAPFDPGDGQRTSKIVRIRDEPEDLQGGYTVSVTSRKNRDGSKKTRTAGPYNFVSNSGSRAVRAWGDDHAFVFEGSDSPSFYRMGTFKADVRLGGRGR